ncbi:MAG: hypothetical protein U0X91_00930 [Spirosomataceae bacterium]
MPPLSAVSWPLWRKVIFRFTALYFLVYSSPLQWLGELPLIADLGGLYNQGEKWLVEWANAHIFHVKDVLVPMAGSGDTSYGYAQLCFFSLFAVLGTVVWSLLDRRRPHYEKGYAWLRIGIRYYVALVSFSYGIIKLFALQMPFPSISQLATPIGDLSPMRLAWFFIGYSSPYEIFSGALECAAGALLIFRRTSTLGAFMAAAVFMNVAMMNLAYNIPVKLFSIHLFVFSNILLAADAQRLLNFFVFNRATAPAPVFTLPKKWMRIGRIALKIAFAGLFIAYPLYNSYQNSLTPFNSSPAKDVLTTGIFEVAAFETDGRMKEDSLRWKEVIFERYNGGTIQTTDTLFRQRYHRAYFSYTLDSLKQHISFKKRVSDSLSLFTLQCTLSDTNTVLLKGKVQNDSLRVVLKRSRRHYPLADKPFDWLLESVP